MVAENGKGCRPHSMTSPGATDDVFITFRTRDKGVGVLRAERALHAAHPDGAGRNGLLQVSLETGAGELLRKKGAAAAPGRWKSDTEV